MPLPGLKSGSSAPPERRRAIPGRAPPLTELKRPPIRIFPSGLEPDGPDLIVDVRTEGRIQGTVGVQPDQVIAGRPVYLGEFSPDQDLPVQLAGEDQDFQVRTSL